MKITQTLIASLLVLGGIGAAQAADGTGAYAGVNVGTPDYHGAVNGIQGSGSGVGAKIYGGYQFNKNFAVEGGYADLGHIDNANGDVKTRDVYVDAVGILPVTDKISLTGSAGVAEARFTTSAGKDSSPGLKAGIGAQYQLTDKVALVSQYDYYHFTNAFDEKPNVGEFSVGVKVGF
ncbi:outer membrane beta-barrel protein [Paucibacter sp. R3-3]|uniref:Outer membrane beta-barrel protein n=1 Tax=Roseateles agri TaxID=3098619 RepID=A0ABU5DSK9_9BURK|nr:outer membrane beta-barrel protein [Paucibacter sp. R3-3]MDY0748695.1 outer membrane beta-barrel protein [Paucibacter sp. R3-3]